MIHIILDTNGYFFQPFKTGKQKQAAPFYHKPAFKALRNLSMDKRITLHLPYFVEQELLSNIKHSIECKFLEHDRWFREFRSNRFPDNVNVQTNEMHQLTSDLKNSLLEQYTNEVKDWFDSLESIRHPINGELTPLVFQDYFQAQGMFDVSNISLNDVDSDKQKRHIIDSFIGYTAIKIAEKYEDAETIFISNDDKLRNFCLEHNLTVFHDLTDFLISDIVNYSEAEIELIRQSDSFKSALDHEQDGDIPQTIKEAFITQFSNWTFEHQDIPEDNNEATIDSIDDREIVCDFDTEHLHYAVGGLIVVPVEISFSADISYCIFKSEYYCMTGYETGDLYDISIEPWNDHYYMAHESILIKIVGKMNISVDPDSLTESNLLSQVEDAAINFIVDDLSISRNPFQEPLIVNSDGEVISTPI